MSMTLYERHPLPWRWTDEGDCDGVLDANEQVVTLCNSGMGQWIVERTREPIDTSCRVYGQRVLIEASDVPSRDHRAVRRVVEILGDWMDERNDMRWRSAPSMSPNDIDDLVNTTMAQYQKTAFDAMVQKLSIPAHLMEGASISTLAAKTLTDRFYNPQ